MLQPIKHYKNIITPETCVQMIKLFEQNKTNQVEGTVSAPGIEAYRSNQYLNSIDIYIGQTELWQETNTILHELFLAPIMAEYLQAYKHIHYGKTYLHPESAILSKYKKLEGHFAPHKDLTVTDYCRDLSFIIYLNDVTSGGETYFHNQDIYIKPTQGSILIFPSSFEYSHQGITPESNDKYIIVTFAEIHIESTENLEEQSLKNFKLKGIEGGKLN